MYCIHDRLYFWQVRRSDFLSGCCCECVIIWLEYIWLVSGQTVDWLTTFLPSVHCRTTQNNAAFLSLSVNIVEDDVVWTKLTGGFKIMSMKVAASVCAERKITTCSANAQLCLRDYWDVLLHHLSPGNPSFGDLISGTCSDLLSASWWSQSSLLWDQHSLAGLLRWRESAESWFISDRQQRSGETHFIQEILVKGTFRILYEDSFNIWKKEIVHQLHYIKLPAGFRSAAWGRMCLGCGRWPSSTLWCRPSLQESLTVLTAADTVRPWTHHFNLCKVSLSSL